MKGIIKHEEAVLNLISFLEENVTSLIGDEGDDDEDSFKISKDVIGDIKCYIDEIDEVTKKGLSVGQQVLITKYTNFMTTDRATGEIQVGEKVCEPGLKGKIEYIDNNNYKPYVEVFTKKGWLRLRTDKPLPFIIIK